MVRFDRRYLSCAAVFLIAISGWSCCRPCCPTTTPHGNVFDSLDADPLVVTDPDDIPALVPLSPTEYLEALGSIEQSPCDSARPSDDGVAILTGDTTYENEIHDCQRLVIVTGTESRFSSLVGIFPVDRSMALRSRLDFAGWIPVATIYNWGRNPPENEEGYEPLGIPRRGSCLWLRSIGRNGPWVATIDNSACRARTGDLRRSPEYSDSARGVRLAVVAHRHSAREYPPTARWGWSRHAHYVGIKCGSEWCSVGRTGFAPREHRVLEGADPERAIPGWYDEQNLAMDPDGDGVVEPGPWGVIYPSADQYAVRNNSATSMEMLEHGMTAAHIVVVRHPPHGFAGYQQKFNMTEDGDTARASIHLQFTPVESPPADNIASIASDTDAMKYAVTATLSSSAHAELYTLSERMETTHAAEGAVRWRWHDHDETAWISCSSGCCPVEP